MMNFTALNLISNLKKATIDNALAILKNNNIDFTYTPETDDYDGSILIGNYWSDHIDLIITDGIVDDIDINYWD